MSTCLGSVLGLEDLVLEFWHEQEIFLHNIQSGSGTHLAN